MQERRRSARYRTFLGGSIAFGRMQGPLDCVVRDMSEIGARLLVDEPMRAPSRMELTVVSRGKTLDARVVWRGAGAVGVAFVTIDDAGVATPPTGVDGSNVISFAAAHRARNPESDREILARRMIEVTRRPSRPPPHGGTGRTTE